MTHASILKKDAWNGMDKLMGSSELTWFLNLCQHVSKACMIRILILHIGIKGKRVRIGLLRRKALNVFQHSNFSLIFKNHKDLTNQLRLNRLGNPDVDGEGWRWVQNTWNSKSEQNIGIKFWRQRKHTLNSIKATIGLDWCGGICGSLGKAGWKGKLGQDEEGSEKRSYNG